MDYKELYNTIKPSFGKFAESINQYRKNTIDTVCNQGFPSTKSEKYKHTPLVDFFSKDYSLTQTIEEKIALPQFPDIDAVKIYTINGKYPYNDIKSEYGYTYGDIETASNSNNYKDIITKYYNQAADNTDSPTALNTAISTSGLFIHVAKGTQAAKPLMVINVVSTEIPLLSLQRNLFVFEENSASSLMLYNVGNSGINTLSNDVSEIIVKQNANTNIVRFHDEDILSHHIYSDYCKQFSKCTFNYTNVVLNGGLVRQNIKVDLLEKHCSCNLYGLVVANKTQHIDSYTFVNHATPECQSNELYKSIVGGNATNIFNGRILVLPDAQKTSAFQSNKNILLDTGAKVYTNPQLEIYADDVKCSHGATIGQLNEDDVFYMQSRGISKKAAELLLMLGFANEILRKANNEAFFNLLTTKLENKLVK